MASPNKTPQPPQYNHALDDTRHGGDIDLLIEPADTVSLPLRARIKTLLEQMLCLPVDLW